MRKHSGSEEPGGRSGGPLSLAGATPSCSCSCPYSSSSSSSISPTNPSDHLVCCTTTLARHGWRLPHHLSVSPRTHPAGRRPAWLHAGRVARCGRRLYFCHPAQAAVPSFECGAGPPGSCCQGLLLNTASSFCPQDRYGGLPGCICSGICMAFSDLQAVANGLCKPSPLSLTVQEHLYSLIDWLHLQQKTRGALCGPYDTYNLYQAGTMSDIPATVAICPCLFFFPSPMERTPPLSFD